MGLPVSGDCEHDLALDVAGGSFVRLLGVREGVGAVDRYAQRRRNPRPADTQEIHAIRPAWEAAAA